MCKALKRLFFKFWSSCCVDIHFRAQVVSEEIQPLAVFHTTYCNTSHSLSPCHLDSSRLYTTFWPTCEGCPTHGR